MTRFEIIDDPLRFDAIAEPWQALWRQYNAGVFQAHGWIKAWLAHAQPAYRLRVGVAWQGDDIVAVVPCAVRRFKGVRMLEWAAQSMSDYCDAFGHPDFVQPLWDAISRRGIDLIRLKNVGPEAVALGVLAASGLVRSDGDCCMLVESQWPSGEAWFRTMNKKKRNNHLRGLRILGELGPVRTEYHTTAPDGLIARLVVLKQGWLAANQLSSPLVDSGPDRLSALVKALAEVNRLCIVLIRCGEEVVAASINAVENKRLLAFFAAYDPKYDRCSPGITLMNEYTKWAFDNGFVAIDYMRGAESYKTEFSTTQINLSSFVGAPSVVGKLALAAYRVYNAMQTSRAPMPGRARHGGAYSTKAGTSRLDDSIASPT